MSLKKLQDILDEIDYPVLMEIVDCSWTRCDDNEYFSWNSADNLEGLENEDGDTYSTESFEGFSEYGGYVVVNDTKRRAQIIECLKEKEDD